MDPYLEIQMSEDEREYNRKHMEARTVKLSVPEHLRTGKVWEALQEQTKERAESSDTLPRKEER